MPVQEKAIPYLLDGHDAMIQSRTGSGKTGGFILPMLDKIDEREAVTQGLVLVPTRELAKQVAAEAALLAGDSGVRVVAVYGGTAYEPQLRAFKEGAHLVVGTPGRVLDHLLRGNLSLDDLEVLVLDEADRMLSMGFYPDMLRVKSCLPRRGVNTCLFSATFPQHVLGLARQFLNNPVTLSLSTDHVHVTDVIHTYCLVEPGEKDHSLVRILEVENPTAAIIFCNTKRFVHYVNVVLQRYGWDSDELSSDLDQNKRERVLQRVRDGKLRILVATDVAARGIDIPELSHVIQFEPPDDVEAFIHRSGRTGRAGASGRAITLVSRSSGEAVQLRRIEKEFDIDIQERPVPTEEEVAEILGQRITAKLEASLRGRAQLEQRRIQRFIPLVRSLAEESDEAVLLAMLLDEYYTRMQSGSAVEEPESDARPRREDSRGDRDRGRGRDSGGGGRRGGGDRGGRGGSGGGGGRRHGGGRR